MESVALDAEVFCAMPSRSRTALVFFGAKADGNRSFQFFKVLKPLPDLTKLLVRDPSDNWYNTGLPEVGDTLEEIAERIEGELSELGARRVVTCGSSMGGYAAILFGCMIGADRAIGIAPQTLLDPILPHAPLEGVDLQAPDLDPIIRDAPGTEVDLVAGWDELLDIFHAKRVAAHPSVRVLAIRNGHHLFTGDLHRAGKLVPLLTELVEGGAPDMCEVDPPLEPEVEQRIADTVYAGQREDWEEATERIRPVVERYPDWAGPSFHYGRALANLGDWKSAESALARAVGANPRWALPREDLAEALCEQGRQAEAEVVIREGLAFDPNWWAGHLSLGECLLRQGRAEEAQAAARLVESGVRGSLAKRPAWAKGHLALAGALLQQGRAEEAHAAARQAMELNPQLTTPAAKLLEQS